MGKFLASFLVLSISLSALAEEPTLTATCSGDGQVEIVNPRTNESIQIKFPTCQEFNIFARLDNTSNYNEFIVGVTDNAALIDVDETGIRLVVQTKITTKSGDVQYVDSLIGSFFSPQKTSRVALIYDHYVTSHGWPLQGSSLISNLTEACTREVGNLMRATPGNPGSAEFRTAVEDFLSQNEQRCSAKEFTFLSGI